jgi:CO dehydrogenase/acetyl-CoA synthase alpha subunit
VLHSIYFLQIAKLQDDNKALDHLTKSKEAALIEAEKTVQVALFKASMVDDLQNKNQELMKQIEICQVSQSCIYNAFCFLWYLLSIILISRSNL